MPMFHNGNRQICRSMFGSTALADRLVERLRRSEFTEDDKTFIESLEYFFLATSDPVGRPDCSFKGGAPGFVRIVKPDLLVWPDYDGNGMFKSLGNIAVNPVRRPALHPHGRDAQSPARATARRRSCSTIR